MFRFFFHFCYRIPIPWIIFLSIFDIAFLWCRRLGSNICLHYASPVCVASMLRIPLKVRLEFRVLTAANTILTLARLTRSKRVTVLPLRLNTNGFSGSVSLEGLSSPTNFNLPFSSFRHSVDLYHTSLQLIAEYALLLSIDCWWQPSNRNSKRSLDGLSDSGLKSCHFCYER